MNSYLDQVKPTYLENWPSELKRLSIAQVGVPLTIEDAKAIGTNITEWAEGFMEKTDEQIEQERASFEWCHRKMLSRRNPSINPGPRVDPPIVNVVAKDISAIRSKVADAVLRFPNGAFVRLGSRSPKDSWLGLKTGFKVKAGEDPLRFMLDCSERIAEDLQLAIGSNYEPWIFVRQWIDMPPESEFRCFMKDRSLVGVSQYQYHDQYDVIAENAGSIEWAIRQFFQSFRHASHLESVVFDVFVTRKPIQGGSLWEVKLLEINPFFEMTDPCLFDWGKEFDGTFRFVKPQAAMGVI